MIESLMDMEIRLKDEKRKLKGAIEFMALDKDVKKRKRELDKAILKGDEDEITHKREILKEVTETRDSFVKPKS